MTGEIQTVLVRLAAADVRYVVVGGVAVVLHGFLRSTGDLDLVLDMDPANLQRAIAVFSQMDFHPRAPVPLEKFADAEERATWAKTKGMKVFSIWSRRVADLEVDLFLDPPMEFEKMYARAYVANLASCDIHVASIDDLIAMKRSAARPVDLDDITALEELKKRE